MREKMDIPLKQ